MHELLKTILTSKRAHGSPGVEHFHKWLVEQLPKPEILAENCIAVTVGTPKTLFSCHIDTVHSVVESDTARQAIVHDTNLNVITLDGEDSSCLGADDGAGVYLMLRMIEAKVPGTYIFHTGEERGGIGSRAVLRDHHAWLSKFKRAVAFDRAGTTDVVITQGGKSCASQVAGAALVKALNEAGKEYNFAYEISHGGTFTDTKVYADVIPECFNLSVGYEFQHTVDEYQDLRFLEQLVAVVCQVDWEDIPTVRVPPPPVVTTPFTSQAPFKTSSPFKPDWEKSTSKTSTQTSPFQQRPASSQEMPSDTLLEMKYFSREDFLNLVEDDFEYAAQVMQYMFVELQAAETRIKTMSTLLGFE